MQYSRTHLLSRVVWGLEDYSLSGIHAQSESAGPKHSWGQAVATLGRPHCQECFGGGTRALNNSAVDRRVLWNQLPGFVKDWSPVGAAMLHAQRPVAAAWFECPVVWAGTHVHPTHFRKKDDRYHKHQILEKGNALSCGLAPHPLFLKRKEKK